MREIYNWEQRKLGEVADIIGGGTPSTRKVEYWDGEINWYSPVEIGEQTYVYNSQKKITELGLQKSSAKVLPIGTVLFTSRAGIGNTAILAKEGATNQGFQSIVPRKDRLNSYFIYSRTHELKRYGETNGAGSTFVEVSGKQMSKMQMLIPTLEEQKRIGDFFERLDHLIALHQRKLELLELMRKSFLQMMFPQKGESRPRLRFTNFNGEWEQRKLGEVANITMGQSPKGDNYTENPDDFILVQGNADIKNGWVSPRIWTTQVTKTADKGDIILSVRAPVGDIGKTQYDVVLGRGVAGIKGNEFIFQSLRKMKLNGFWARYSTGSTFESINSIDLKEALFNIPDEAEQTKIGTFFKQIDKTITLHQTKLHKMQSLKKAFLQKMFI